MTTRTRKLYRSRLLSSSRHIKRGRDNVDALLRFITVSDTHFGINDNNIAPTTEMGKYQNRMQLVIDNIIDEEQSNGLDFLIGNGDIVHSSSSDYSNSEEMLEVVLSDYFSQINIPYYLTPGNHDLIDNSTWYNLVGRNRSTAFEYGDFGFILLDSSDTDGARQKCLDESFLNDKLNEYSDKKGVFFVSHVPRYDGNFHAEEYAKSPDCDPIMQALINAKNVILMQSGHFHRLDSKDVQTDVPLYFGGHVSNYGVKYYGYRTFDVYEEKVVTKQWDLINQRIVNQDIVYF